MTDFSNLNQYDPQGRKAWFPLPIEGIPELELMHAGGSNKPYTTALGKRVAKRGAAGRAEVKADPGSALKWQVDTDRALFPRYVVTGWRGITDSADAPVPFSANACAEFFDALPDWIVQEISAFAGVASNFLPDDMPDEDEVEAQAKN